MNEMSIEARWRGRRARPPAGRRGNRQPPATGIDGEALSAADYCHLAEECFFLAAVANDPEAAAKLVKAGDDYLRRAAEWLADQLQNG